MRVVLYSLFFGLFGVLWSGCKENSTPPITPPKTTKVSTSQPTSRLVSPPPHFWFDTPTQAFERVLKQKPHILGIGEIHQVQRQKHIPSAIERFTKKMLPSLWGVATDLIVETWVTTGQCGTQEVKVTKHVRTITKRPKQTENQIVTLLKAAKNLGIQPHILTVHCATYQNLMRHSGTEQTRQLILLVTRLLLQKIREVIQQRQKQKQQAVLLIYGGAIHNDIHPDPTWAHYSYVPKLLKQIQTHSLKFVELDLYVPEYLDDDDELHRHSWYPLYLQQQKTRRSLLVRRAKNSYLLLLPWSSTRTSPPPSTLHPAPPKRTP